MSNNAIAIFVKTPGLSPLKTRLAKYIGEENALQLYLLCIEAIKTTIQRTGIKAYWAVAEQKGMNDPLWKDFERLWTGPDELGENQHRIYSSLLKKHEQVALIGADCPQMPAYMILNAFCLLQDYQFLIGPAADGGYYMFGGSKPLPMKSWTNVTYSAQNTRKELINNLPSTPFMLHELNDVDHKADMKEMLEQMPPIPSPEQRKLINFAHKVLEET